MKDKTYNPDKAPKQLGSWLAVWDWLKANNLHNNEIVKIICEEPRPAFSEYLKLTEYTLTREYVIKRAFLEIEAFEPQPVSEELISQYYGAVHLLKIYHFDQLSTFLDSFFRKAYRDNHRATKMKGYKL